MKRNEDLSLSADISPSVFDSQYYSSGVYARTYKEDVLSWVGKVAKKVNRLLRDVSCPCVLDVGCAHGFLLAELQKKYGIEVHGLEYSRYALQHAEKTVRGKIREGNILTAELPSRAFDAVICLDVFEYLTLKEVLRAAKHLVQWSNSFIIFSTIYKNSRHISQKTNPDPFRKSALTQVEYRNIFLRAGAKFIESFDADNGGSALVFKKVGKKQCYTKSINDRINKNDKRKSGNAK